MMLLILKIGTFSNRKYSHRIEKIQMAVPFEAHFTFRINLQIIKWFRKCGMMAMKLLFTQSRKRPFLIKISYFSQQFFFINSIADIEVRKNGGQEMQQLRIGSMKWLDKRI